MTASPIFTQNDVFQYNQARYEEYKKIPFITRLLDGTYKNNPTKIKKFIACVSIFGHFFQKFTLTRLATCANQSYYSIFYEHYREELGHDAMLDEQPNIPVVYDATLEALSDWFAYQMLVCDNIEKAAIHLVLETSGDYYHKAAQESIGKVMSNDYYNIHAACEEQHINLVKNLFSDKDSQTYAGVLQVLEKAWNTLIAMNNRMVLLIDQ